MHLPEYPNIDPTATADQQPQQREVEDEVAGLAQVAALGATR